MIRPSNNQNSTAPGEPELVSVVVATYNQSRYLPTTLDSIWFQDYPNVEIIVVNDGSNDDTKAILSDFRHMVDHDRVSFASHYNEDTRRVERACHDRYPKLGRKFVLLENTTNMGLSASLNKGIKKASGQLCTFIASDDVLLPSMLSDLQVTLERHDADFVYADMHIVDDAGRILRRFSLPDYTFENAFCHWYLCGVCKLYRRDLHESVGYYDEHIKPQDHEMFLRFAMHGARFVHLPKVLANVRIHDGQRRVDNHLPENWTQLYRESAALVCRARRYLREGR